MNRQLLATLLFALALAGSPLALAENDHDHGEDHGDHGDHAGDGEGPWSYLERDNPTPYAPDERHEMLPVPQFGHMYIHAGRVDAETRCDALMEASQVMVDRQTREACGETVEADHDGHEGQENHDDHHH